MCHVVNGIKCPAVNCTCSFKGIEGLSLHFKMIHKQKLDRNSLELKCEKCDYVTYKESAMESHISVSKQTLESTIKAFIKCNIICTLVRFD